METCLSLSWYSISIRTPENRVREIDASVTWNTVKRRQVESSSINQSIGYLLPPPFRPLRYPERIEMTETEDVSWTVAQCLQHIGRYRKERGHHQMKTTQWWHAWFKVSIIITIIIIIILICITSIDTFYHISALNSVHTIIILTCITDTDISIISTWVNIIGFSIIVWIKTVAEQFLYDNRYIKSLLININTISTVIKQLTHDTYHTINHSHIIISTMFIYT